MSLGLTAKFWSSVKSYPAAVCVTAVIVYLVALPAIVKVSCIAGAEVNPSTDKVFAVYGNGSLGEFTVDSNNRITLTSAPFPTGTRVGFNFTPILETMPIDKEIDTGPLTGQPRRVNKAIVDISGGLDITMKAQDLNSKELVIQQAGFTAGTDISPVTDKKEFNFLGYSKNPTITISQNDPLPLKVLGIAMELQFAWVLMHQQCLQLLQ